MQKLILNTPKFQPQPLKFVSGYAPDFNHKVLFRFLKQFIDLAVTPSCFLGMSIQRTSNPLTLCASFPVITWRTSNIIFSSGFFVDTCSTIHSSNPCRLSRDLGRLSPVNPSWESLPWALRVFAYLSPANLLVIWAMYAKWEKDQCLATLTSLCCSALRDVTIFLWKHHMNFLNQLTSK